MASLDTDGAADISIINGHTTKVEGVLVAPLSARMTRPRTIKMGLLSGSYYSYITKGGVAHVA